MAYKQERDNIHIGTYVCMYAYTCVRMYVAVTNDVRGTPPTRVNNNTVLVSVLEDYNTSAFVVPVSGLGSLPQ